ncbi:ADYC domain-containing protein [Falsiroseomonas sp.]|uniref:ADYC domain-containing protein n=1 Tax=Falsiroseomonas sp. TaxID=2870721 RepID=UPI003F6F2842
MRRLLPLLLLLAGSAAAQQPPRLIGLRAEGGDFRVDLSDGTALHGADLVGAVLQFDGMELRLDTARRDEAVPMAGGARAGDVWLFQASARSSAATEWQAFCGADPQGERLLMPYPGPDGMLRLTCSAGGIGKCIRFGYRPWASLPDGRSLAPFHAACVHMMRGAYGDAERAWTRDGTRIDLYDRVGIQSPAMEAEQSFEAGWTPQGAVCVAHMRVPENGDLAALLAAAPHLAGRTGPEACTEARAEAEGALLFNRSHRAGGD